MKKIVDSQNIFKSYLQLISIPDFWAYTLIMSLGIGAFFVFISGVSLVADKQFDMSQAQIGLGIGSITFGFLFGSFLSGRLAANYSLDAMILSGRCVACLGLFLCLLVFSFGFVSPLNLLAGTMCVGVGNGLTSPSASSAVMFVRKELSASASGLSGAVIVVVGAIMTSITGAILDLYPNAFALVCMMFSVTFLSFVIAIWISTRPKKLTIQE